MSINSSFKNNHSTAKGFTLIEVIVALSIGILVMTMTMAIVTPGFKNVRTVSQTKELHANVVYIINTLTYEIKQAENLEVSADKSELIITLAGPTVKIVKKDGENITLDSMQLNDDNVKITNLEFIGMQKSVRINFTIESITGEQSLPVTTTIAQRNNL